MMMATIKCKRHPYERGVGVCASCLRERLLELIAAQSGRPHHHQQLLQHQSSSTAARQQLRDPQPPPPLVFPRSVSPYVSRRRTVDLDDVPDDAEAGSGCRRSRQSLRFFSTPQVGPGASRMRATGGGFLASLFGGGHQSRSEEVEPEFVASGGSHGSGSWFSALLPGRRKKQQKKMISRFFEAAAAAEAAEEEDRARRGVWGRDRKAPRATNVYGGAEDDSPSESGYSTESSSGWRIPAPTPLRKHISTTQRTMSGFVVCLSPLVRASPRRSQAGEGGGAPGLSAELRGHRSSSLPRHHQRYASGGGGPPALAPNRSRKLADLGRFR